MNDSFLHIVCVACDFGERVKNPSLQQTLNGRSITTNTLDRRT